MYILYKDTFKKLVYSFFTYTIQYEFMSYLKSKQITWLVISLDNCKPRQYQEKNFKHFIKNNVIQSLSEFNKFMSWCKKM